MSDLISREVILADLRVRRANWAAFQSNDDYNDDALEESADEHVEDLDSLITIVEALPAAQPRIAVGVDGGAVQWALTDQPGIRVTIVDFDVEGVTEFELWRVRDAHGDDEAPANVYDEDVDVCPHYFTNLDLSPQVNGEDELLSQGPDDTKWIVTTDVHQLSPDGTGELYSGYYAGATADEAIAEANKELQFLFGDHKVFSQKAMRPAK